MLRRFLLKNLHSSGVEWMSNTSKPSSSAILVIIVYKSAVHNLYNKLSNDFSLVCDQNLSSVRVKRTDDLSLQPSLLIRFAKGFKGIVNRQRRQSASIGM